MITGNDVLSRAAAALVLSLELLFVPVGLSTDMEQGHGNYFEISEPIDGGPDPEGPIIVELKRILEEHSLVDYFVPEDDHELDEKEKMTRAFIRILKEEARRHRWGNQTIEKLSTACNKVIEEMQRPWRHGDFPGQGSEHPKRFGPHTLRNKKTNERFSSRR